MLTQKCRKMNFYFCKIINSWKARGWPGRRSSIRNRLVWSSLTRNQPCLRLSRSPSYLISIRRLKRQMLKCINVKIKKTRQLNKCIYLFTLLSFFVLHTHHNMYVPWHKPHHESHTQSLKEEVMKYYHRQTKCLKSIWDSTIYWGTLTKRTNKMMFQGNCLLLTSKCILLNYTHTSSNKLYFTFIIKVHYLSSPQQDSAM